MLLQSEVLAIREGEVELAYRPGRSRAVLVVLGMAALAGLAGVERRRRPGTSAPIA